MKRIEKKINTIANSICESVIDSIRMEVMETTGREIEIISLSPEFKFRFADEKKVYQLDTVLFNTKKKNYKIFKGKEEFCLKCREIGLRSYDYGKEVQYNGKRFKIVGVYENTQSFYKVLMGPKGGLYLTKE